MGAMNELIDLRGKEAVVTGGSRGVGRATALLLAQAGASVGIGYMSRKAEADDTVGELKAQGVHAWGEAGDLARAEDAARLFSRADQEFDGLDIFVGNAGIWIPNDVPIADMNDAQWRRTVEANLDSIFFTTREAARRVRAGGRISALR
jgi:3-oxoacyl-[acyl-carrier protein] reductase